MLLESPTHSRAALAGLVLVLTLTAAATPVAASALRVNGSTTVNPVVVKAAEILRAERGLEIVVDTLGGSSGGISALGEGRAELGMISRPLIHTDREKYPGVDFRVHPVGADAVALVVSPDVWEGGVRSLSRAEMQAIYERRIRNWKEVGGPDRRIVVFNKEPGRGTWEVFAHWLYGSGDAAPLVSHPEVGANEEARSKVRSTRGALSQLSASWVDGETIYALAIEAAGGELVGPTAENIASGRYPMSRPLNLVTDGEPDAVARQMIDFLRGGRGRAIVTGEGYLPVAEAATGAAAE